MQQIKVQYFASLVLSLCTSAAVKQTHFILISQECIALTTTTTQWPIKT